LQTRGTCFSGADGESSESTVLEGRHGEGGVQAVNAERRGGAGGRSRRTRMGGKMGTKRESSRVRDRIRIALISVDACSHRVRCFPGSRVYWKWDHNHSQVPYMGLTRSLSHSPPEVVFERWRLRLSAGGLSSSPARQPAGYLDHGDIARLDSCVITTVPDTWYNYGIKKSLTRPTDVSHIICPSH